MQNAQTFGASTRMLRSILARNPEKCNGKGTLSPCCRGRPGRTIDGHAQARPMPENGPTNTGHPRPSRRPTGHGTCGRGPTIRLGRRVQPGMVPGQRPGGRTRRSAGTGLVSEGRGAGPRSGPVSSRDAPYRGAPCSGRRPVGGHAVPEGSRPGTARGGLHARRDVRQRPRASLQDQAQAVAWCRPGGGARGTRKRSSHWA